MQKLFEHNRGGAKNTTFMFTKNQTVPQGRYRARSAVLTPSQSVLLLEFSRRCQQFAEDKMLESSGIPPYSPSIGCDAALDGWCNQHCPPSADGSELVARQPSSDHTFACFSRQSLMSLETVNHAIPAPSRKCGRKSTEYVRTFKMTRESAELAMILTQCTRNYTLLESNAASLARRQARISVLNKNLLDARPLAGVVADDATAWLAADARSEPDAKARCVASGNGSWHAAASSADEPYLLAADYLPAATTGKWWWGTCDDDLRRGRFRPPRAAVLQHWEPSGDGCSALRKGRDSLPSLQTLGAAFCRRHAGKTVLFVGDSVQGQLASSFASALGVWKSEPQMRQPMPRCAKDRGYLHSLSKIHEFNLEMLLCAADRESGVRVLFIRNELLWLGSGSPSQARRAAATAAAAAAVSSTLPSASALVPSAASSLSTSSSVTALPSLAASPPPPHVPRSFVLCGWAEAALSADLIVLNRGMHFSPDATVLSDLKATFEQLLDQRRRHRSARGSAGAGAGASAPSELASSVVYRGVHAPIPSCHVLDDPLPRPFPYAATDATLEAYHWPEFGRQNAQVARLAAAHNITFLDVHAQTARRPGGHMPGRKSAAGDCAHYCIPGPLDEWVRMLLALWT